MHRIVATDDRDSMGGAMNLDDIQKRHVTALGQGRAIVYAEKMEQPFHLAIMYDKSREVPPPDSPEESDEIVRQAMKGLNIVENFDKHLGCRYCLHRCDSKILDTATIVADDPLFRQVYNRYILSTVKDLTELVKFRGQIIHEIQRVIGGRARTGNITGIAWCVLTQASERYFERKGEENYWDYKQVQEQHLRWLDLLKPAFQPSEVNRRLDIEILKQWRDDFLELHKRDMGPLPTCGPCTSKCFYRFEVSELVRDPKVKSDFNASINRKDTTASDAAAWFCRLLTERLIGQPDIDLAYCLAAHLIKDQQLSTDAQLVLLYKVRTALENEKNNTGPQEENPAQENEPTSEASQPEASGTVVKEVSPPETADNQNASDQ